ncbi:hypothetical protein NSE01_09410 [Novosphingobium sediminis]|uniref:Uncharacterized protein n=1 Tax=Novosphingobium sediminis TaxID=707214 RepID=A0A512AHC6_9SPHN|nr:hypothetical protein [Novosphingobium sediminis]GEN99108.1 hypothetical protein NSE01_09410 [Novosphingobium sediminis]
MKSPLLRAAAAFSGIAVFLIFAFTLQDRFSVPFALTYRIACALACFWLAAKLITEYPDERWPKIALLIAALCDLGLFFSPLRHLPASKGDILFFAAPYVLVFLTARISTFQVNDVHQRAVRQQMVLGLVLAIAFCAIFLSIMLMPEHPAH